MNVVVGFHTWLQPNLRINEPIPDSWKGVPPAVAIECRFERPDVDGFAYAPFKPTRFAIKYFSILEVNFVEREPYLQL